jgi:hypothetical protein
MNIIKTIKYAAAGALMYAAATLGIGCSTIPMYDITNNDSIVRFENKQNLTERLNCWHRIDIKSGEDPQDMEEFFAKILPEYDLGKGFSAAAQYLAVSGEDIVIFCYNEDNFKGSALFLYNTENGTIYGELTAKFGRGNIKPFVQLVGYGSFDDLEGMVKTGLELLPK